MTSLAERGGPGVGDPPGGIEGEFSGRNRARWREHGVGAKNSLGRHALRLPAQPRAVGVTRRTAAAAGTEALPAESPLPRGVVAERAEKVDLAQVGVERLDEVELGVR